MARIKNTHYVVRGKKTRHGFDGEPAMVYIDIQFRQADEFIYDCLSLTPAEWEELKMQIDKPEKIRMTNKI